MIKINRFPAMVSKNQGPDSVYSGLASHKGGFTDVIFTMTPSNLHNVILPYVFNITFKRIKKKMRDLEKELIYRVRRLQYTSFF